VDVEALIQSMYEAFNARDIDAALATTAVDVDWPNGWKGGREHGHDAVREYWLAQWAEINPQVEPLAVRTRPDGLIEVEVHQVVRDLDGVVLSDGRVLHVYELRDGLVARMDIEEVG
jgi:hypothetical protein